MLTYCAKHVQQWDFDLASKVQTITNHEKHKKDTAVASSASIYQNLSYTSAVRGIAWDWHKEKVYIKDIWFYSIWNLFLCLWTISVIYSL